MIKQELTLTFTPEHIGSI